MDNFYIAQGTGEIIRARGTGQEINGKEVKEQIVSINGANSTGLMGDTLPKTPEVYNIPLTLANTEYSQAMPANCKFFEFHCRTVTDIRYQFVTGRVATPTAPYLTLPAANWYASPQLNQGAAPSTLYLASATAGVAVEIIAWV